LAPLSAGPQERVCEKSTMIQEASSQKRGQAHRGARRQKRDKTKQMQAQI